VCKRQICKLLAIMICKLLIASIISNASL